jgi:hypothetical protein
LKNQVWVEKTEKIVKQSSEKGMGAMGAMDQSQLLILELFNFLSVIMQYHVMSSDGFFVVPLTIK